MNNYKKLTNKKEEIIKDINCFMSKLNKDVLEVSKFISNETSKLKVKEKAITAYLKDLRNVDAVSLRPTLEKINELVDINNFYGFNTSYTGDNLGFIKKEKITGKPSNEKVLVTRDNSGDVVSVIKGKSETIRNFTIIFLEKELLKIKKEKEFLANNLTDIENSLKLSK